MPAGYSGTPLAKKLGLKGGLRVSTPGAPTNYRKLLTPLPDGIEFQARVTKTTDITEDTIRAVALPMGLVDIKVCAVDETWSGLKLVLRKELRTR